MQLHAALLSFDHPVTGHRLSVYAQPPTDFEMRENVSKEVLERWP